jgi:hypothetical protein
MENKVTLCAFGQGCLDVDPNIFIHLVGNVLSHVLRPRTVGPQHMAALLCASSVFPLSRVWCRFWSVMKMMTEPTG